MRITNFPANLGRVASLRDPKPSAPPPPPPAPGPQDQAEIRASQKRMWRNLEWASFGGQLVGGSLVLAHQGGIGLAIFAASSAAMVYSGYKGRSL